MAAKSGFRFSPMLQSIAMRLACGLLAIPLLTGIGGIAHGAPAADDWFTMNKDYSAQRYVDLDQITPENVGGLREVCEVELNQPVFFTSGLVMAGGGDAFRHYQSPDRRRRRRHLRGALASCS
jgi:hypothetical protein